MIHFKCIYCGQRIRAPDDGADKKGKCPNCKHLLTVPLTTKGRPAISPDKEQPPDRSKPRVPAWDKAPDFWFKDPRSCFIESPDALVDLCKEEFSFLIPTYDELSLFLISATMIIFYLANSRMRNQINAFFAKAAETNAWVLFVPLVVLLVTIGLCIYHAFTTREKTTLEKKIMMVFAVLTNFAAGTIAAVYTLKGTGASNWLLVFPIWNIINGVLMLIMVSLEIIDEDCISDRDANTTEVIIGLIAVLIIFALCNYAFKLHLAITFSICIIYTTSFDRALQSVFPGSAYRGNHNSKS